MAQRELRNGDHVRVARRVLITSPRPIEYGHLVGRVDSTTVDGYYSVLVFFGADTPAQTFHPSELEIVE